MCNTEYDVYLQTVGIQIRINAIFNDTLGIIW